MLDPAAPVVVVTANDEGLASDLVALATRGLCMVTSVCRNVSDLEKLVKNIGSNLSVHFVLLAGEHGESQAAVEALGAILTGRSDASEKASTILKALRRKIDSGELTTLQAQVQTVDMLGCVEVDRIIGKVNELASDARRPNTGFVAPGEAAGGSVDRVLAANNISYDLQLDKAGGYIVRIERRTIVVEHYNSKGELLRVVEGANARDLCITLIRNGWVSKLDHAAYLGRELARAEMALREDRPYAQDTI